MLLLLLSRFSHVWLCATPQTAAHQAPPSRDSPGKNTGVGCHFLLQCMKIKSEREVTQLCPTLSDPMDCSLPGSSVHGTLQARVLEWGAIDFSDLGIIMHSYMHKHIHVCFPSDSDGKDSAWNVGDIGSVPGLERYPGEGNGYPLQYSCLGNPLDRGTWWAIVHRIAKELDMS